VNTTVGLSGKGRLAISNYHFVAAQGTYTDRVDDTESQSASLQTVPHGQDGIGGLSRLRDKDGDIIPENRRPSVKEVRGELDSDGNISQFLKHGSNGDTRVVRGTTRDKQQSSAPSDDGKVCLETTKHDGPGVKVDSSSHRVDDGFGLLVDLLLHEVGVLSLHDFGEFDLEVLDGSDGRETIVSSQSVNVEF
jgi:hypothetical protein